MRTRLREHAGPGPAGRPDDGAGPVVTSATGRFIERWKENRFLVLLVLLLSYFVLTPIVEDSPGKLLVRTTLISFVFLAAIGCLQFRTSGFGKFRWFGVVTILCGWIPVVTDLPGFLITSDAFRILFFAGVAVALIYQIAASAEVTLGTILGAIDGYLLLGFISAAGLTIVQLSSPGAIASSSGAALGATDFVYFAFITMTTVGYGDILPVSAGARSLAVLIATAGQLYIAILISLLVGKYLGSRPPAPPLE
jgi:voltage-gated potassium channel